MKMRFGVGMGRNESVNEVGAHARLAEECGFELVTLVDEPFLARDIFTALAMVAVNTDRVLIGHGVVDPLTYFPTALGNSAATLNELSGGRAFLGLGAGGPAGKFMDPLPFKKFEESVLFLKKFMRGEEAEYGGHMIRSEWIRDPVPLYLAADGPRSLKLAGRVGDGVITMPGSPTLMKWKLGFVAEGAEEAGRDPAEIDVWVRSILIVAESKEAAFREGSSFLPGSLQIGNYIRLRNAGYREEIDRMLKELDREQPGIVDEILATLKVFDHFAFERLDNPASKVATQRVVDFFNQTGTEDDVCEGIEKLGEAGVKCLATATYTIIDKKAHLEAVGKRIIPRFKG